MIPPCDSCQVDLIEENKEAAQVYMMTRGQYITAGEGNTPVDISILAVKAVMDIYGVKDQKECLGKVRYLWHEMQRRKDGGNE